MIARPVLLSVAALAAVALSGCSAGGRAAETTMSYQDSLVAGPLAQALLPTGQGGGSDEQRTADTTELEERVAACMTEQGFEYTPEPWSPYDGSFPGDWRPDDRDWVSQWGYGSLGFPAMAAMYAEEAVPDPNDEYYAGLSAAEQAVYSDTLWGPLLPLGQPTTWEDEGCKGAAAHDFYGDDPRDTDEFRPLMSAISAFQASELESPEFAEIDAAWADCMAGKGHGGFTRQADAQKSIDDARYEIFVGPAQPLDLDDPAFDDLRAQELDLALADLDCREQTGYREKAREITYALEDQFVADHRAELDALVAAAEAAKAEVGQ